MLVTTRAVYYLAMEELIGNQAAAAHVGLQPATWRHYVAKKLAPEPSRRQISGGHALPVWTRAQLDEWMVSRPGRGAPGRSRNRRTSTRSAPSQS